MFAERDTGGANAVIIIIITDLYSAFRSEDVEYRGQRDRGRSNTIGIGMRMQMP